MLIQRSKPYQNHELYCQYSGGVLKPEMKNYPAHEALDISQKIDLDISTISRVTNSKYIETPYGTFLQKSFSRMHITKKMVQLFLIRL